MLSKTCRRLMAGAVAALALCLPAVANLVVDDFEDGDNKNAFGQYWYTYSTYTSGMTLTPKTTPTVPLTPVSGGASGSNYAAEMTYEGLNGAGNYPEIGIGVGLTAGDDVGFGSEMNKVDSIAFWVKGVNDVTFFFGVHTIENASNDDKYGKRIKISGTGWTRHAVALKSGTNALAQDGFGTAFTFNKANVAKISWSIKKADNTNASANGAFAIDNVTLIGSITESAIPPTTATDLCNTCASGTFGPPSPSVLLADFTTAQNKLGYYSYSYPTDKAGTTVAPGTAGRGEGNGYSIDFVVSGTGNLFAGLGVSLSDNAITTPLDASGFTGVYFEYKTSGTGVDKVRFEVVEKVSANSGENFYINLPGTGGEWKAAVVNFSQLVFPDWAETPRGALNKSELAKLQLAYASAGSGTIAVDNIYFLGDDKFPGQSGGGGGDPVVDPPDIPPVVPPVERTVTFAVSPVDGGRVVSETVSEGGVPVSKVGTAEPSEGYRFLKWAEDGGTDPTRTVSLPVAEDITFTALFERKPTVRYVAGEGGLVKINGGAAVRDSTVTRTQGSSVTALAVADAGYRFVMWDDDKDSAGRTDGYEDKVSVFTAIFTPLPIDPGTGAVLFTYAAGVGGKVKKADGGVLGPVVDIFVEPGRPGEAVTAVANDGYRFVMWSDSSAEETRKDTAADAPMTFSAVFAPVTYTVIYAAGDGGLLKVGDAAANVPACTVQVAAGANAGFVRAVANSGYKFIGWSDNIMEAVRMDEIKADLKVTAIFLKSDAVAAPSREIPAAPAAEVSVVAPVVVFAGEFAAGPNPAASEVKFFRTGRAIKTGKLLVYDASGSVVTKISLNDKGANGKRVVGAWNLKDNKGRQVANGSYVVKGTVTTKDGVREKVSTVISVAK